MEEKNLPDNMSATEIMTKALQMYPSTGVIRATVKGEPEETIPGFVKILQENEIGHRRLPTFLLRKGAAAATRQRNCGKRRPRP